MGPPTSATAWVLPAPRALLAASAAACLPPLAKRPSRPSCRPRLTRPSSWNAPWRSCAPKSALSWFITPPSVPPCRAKPPKFIHTWAPRAWPKSPTGTALTSSFMAMPTTAAWTAKPPPAFPFTTSPCPCCSCRTRPFRSAFSSFEDGGRKRTSPAVAAGEIGLHLSRAQAVEGRGLGQFVIIGSGRKLIVLPLQQPVILYQVVEFLVAA